ncbi:MAG: hypothetical protein HY445_03570 [Candidatus Niyogibacteria bacterium]|nr:hypothetical protein [Candidatus Niyogibacteria bacterium]
MTTQSKQEQVKQTLETIIAKMGISASIDAVEYFDGLKFNVRSHEAGMLIGDNGTHLQAINHIVKRISDKGRAEGDPHFQFLIDVNDYHKQRTDHLHELARMSAQRVRYFKKEIEMKPMNAFERRIIHAALTECPDITTESTGEGDERRVVIRPL